MFSLNESDRYLEIAPFHHSLHLLCRKYYRKFNMDAVIYIYNGKTTPTTCVVKIMNGGIWKAYIFLLQLEFLVLLK